MFIPDFIWRIFSTPSILIWALDLIISATLHQSLKSFHFFTFYFMFFKKCNNFIRNIWKLYNNKYSRLFFSLLWLLNKPHRKYEIKDFNSSSSLMCWDILNLNETTSWLIKTKKFPSPKTNPTIHWGCGICPFFFYLGV